MRIVKSLFAAGLLALCLCCNPLLASAELTPVSPWEAEALPDPDVAAMAWASSIAQYQGLLLYVAEDGRVRAMDAATGQTSVVADLSADANFMFGASSLLVTDDGRLYFLDNGMSNNLYRLDLTAAWPADHETLDTGASGSIYSLTADPETGLVWLSSADFLEGDSLYLYSIAADFSAATEVASFDKVNGGGNGPIIFQAPDELLYGEAPWSGDGAFHLVNTATGDLAIENDMTFASGLVGADYGYNDEIYVTTGYGGTVTRLAAAGQEVVANSDQQVQGLAFVGNPFYVSTMNGTGSVFFHKLSHPDPNSLVADDDDGGSGSGGGGGCVLAAGAGFGFEWLLLAGFGLILARRRG